MHLLYDTWCLTTYLGVVQDFSFGGVGLVTENALALAEFVAQSPRRDHYLCLTMINAGHRYPYGTLFCLTFCTNKSLSHLQNGYVLKWIYLNVDMLRRNGETLYPLQKMKITLNRAKRTCLNLVNACTIKINRFTRLPSFCLLRILIHYGMEGNIVSCEALNAYETNEYHNEYLPPQLS